MGIAQQIHHVNNYVRLLLCSTVKVLSSKWNAIIRNKQLLFLFGILDILVYSAEDICFPLFPTIELALVPSMKGMRQLIEYHWWHSCVYL